MHFSHLASDAVIQPTDSERKTHQVPEDEVRGRSSSREEQILSKFLKEQQIFNLITGIHLRDAQRKRCAYCLVSLQQKPLRVKKMSCFSLISKVGNVQISLQIYLMLWPRT